MKNQNLEKVGLRKGKAKKIAIKLIPEALALAVAQSMASFKSEKFSFSCEVDETTQTIVTNDDELLFKTMDDGLEPLQFSKNLDSRQIVDRLARKFGLV